MNESYVTYNWLIGSGLTLLGITIPLMLIFGKGKVNKEFCGLMHDKTDQVITLLNTTLISQSQLLHQTHDAIIRLEAIIKINNGLNK